MDKTQLEELFCAKLYLEIEKYKFRIRKKGADEIIEKSYEIDCMVNIYEMLREKCKEFDSDTLQCLIVVPDILVQCYRRWLKYEDSFQDELWACLHECVESICDMEQGKLVVKDAKVVA